MNVKQFVMAYEAEHDRLRAIMPDGYDSLRPVLRINAEIQDNLNGYVEFNTAVKKGDTKGWLNIANWNNVPFEINGKNVTFKTSFLEISFTGVGIEGSCPTERDNSGCYFIGETVMLKAPEKINCNKEFCDCCFQWKFTNEDAHGVSLGKTLPAYPSKINTIYPKKTFSAENAAIIPCKQVLGAYSVEFIR